MAELKTKANDSSVEAYLNGITDPKRRKECTEVLHLMESIVGEPAIMWGKSIVGMGRYQMTYANGKKGEWMISAFSSRKQALTIYIMAGFSKFEELLNKLGEHKTGKSCLYIKTLDNIDLDVLKTLIESSVQQMEPLRVKK